VPAVVITPDDLAPFATIEPAKAQAMIEDALALAARVAPCINDPEFMYDDAAKAILRGAILRWNEAGTGSVQYQTAGAYSVSVDTKQPRRSMFWPSEITDLQQLCQETQEAKAFSVDTAPQLGPLHPPFCGIYFGGVCDCGIVDIGRVYVMP
jgi:hypothetical protein